MEHQKIANLLESESDNPSRLRTRNWVEINDEWRGNYANSDIRFKTTMLKLIYVIMQTHTYLSKEQ